MKVKTLTLILAKRAANAIIKGVPRVLVVRIRVVVVCSE